MTNECECVNIRVKQAASGVVTVTLICEDWIIIHEFLRLRLIIPRVSVALTAKFMSVIPPEG